MKLERSIPYFNALIKASKPKRMSILQSFPSFVIDDMLEVLLNIVLGKVDIATRKKNILKKHQKPLIDLVNTKNKKLMRKVIYKQSGGFLGALIPIILSTLGGIIGSNV